MLIYETAYSIVKKLQDHGFIAYFTGGWVRDFLMNHPSDDIDIATNATVENIQKIFPKTIPVGVQFGIIIVVENQHQFEVATFRKDHGYEDGRRPIGFEHSSPEEDAKRRDFTINGMFYDPLTKTLFDFVNGQQDLEKKIIRAIGNPHQRFLEDRLRMIRAIRYACRLHFTIDPSTQEAICLHANALFPSVAIERVWQEFYKMKQFGSFKKFILKLHETKLLQTIFEELETLSYESLTHLLHPLDHFPSDAPILGKILELFPNYNLSQKLALCEKFKLSNQDKAFVSYYHQIKENFKNPLDLYSWAHLYAHDHFFLCLKMAIASYPEIERSDFLKIHHERHTLLQSAIEHIRNHNPLLQAKHLLAAGIKPGALMGKLLKEGEKIGINEHLNSAETILLKLKQHPLWP
ncbi:MAG: CCA tRNA nucleotidyltransferase [Chlamydiota bacterium]